MFEQQCLSDLLSPSRIGQSLFGYDLHVRVACLNCRLECIVPLIGDIILGIMENPGDLALLAERFDDAVAQFRDALSYDADNASATYNLATALFDAGQMIEAFAEADRAIALDPTRLTLICGGAGYDGTAFKGLLAERFDIQLNKTSRNSVLLQTNINNTRSDIAYLIKVLADMSRELERRLTSDPEEKAAFDARVKSLVTDVPDLPNFSRFHDAFREDPRGKTNEGDMRTPFFLAYDAENCTHVRLNSKEIDDMVKSGQAVSAKFVIPYPPGFPIMVPGQVITKETIDFMRKLDVKEIHGYQAALGLELIKPEKLGGAKRKARK